MVPHRHRWLHPWLQHRHLRSLPRQKTSVRAEARVLMVLAAADEVAVVVATRPRKAVAKARVADAVHATPKAAKVVRARKPVRTAVRAMPKAVPSVQNVLSVQNAQTVLTHRTVPMARPRAVAVAAAVAVANDKPRANALKSTAKPWWQTTRRLKPWSSVPTARKSARTALRAIPASVVNATAVAVVVAATVTSARSRVPRCLVKRLQKPVPRLMLAVKWCAKAAAMANVRTAAKADAMLAVMVVLNANRVPIASRQSVQSARRTLLQPSRQATKMLTANR